jgi:hypothetical protein
MKSELEVRDAAELYDTLARHHAVIVLYEDEEPELTAPILRVARDDTKPVIEPRLRSHCRYGLLMRPHFTRGDEVLALVPYSVVVRVLCPFGHCAVLRATPSEETREEELTLSWPARVAPGLFVGDFLAARNPFLGSLGIEAIVDASQLPRRGETTLAELRVAVHDDDAADIAQFFDCVSAFISSHSGGCLVVCAAGVSRSCALLAAHLMISGKVSLKEAMRTIRAVRPIARPNRGFLEQLLPLELRLRGERSATIYELDKV